MKLKTLSLVLFIFISGLFVNSQEKKSNNFDGLEFRNLGPAFTSGRIADIAIHPDNESVWYVAVGSGGVWKTTNAGTTWKPIFEKENSYSIGCVTIDPNNHHTIWVGTGENVGGRHVGFGDGIYVSYDDGNSWKNMGLKTSEHISKIIIDPENSDIIWVAAQGPLWSKGGERGVYKSVDGGKSWKNVLQINEWTGATDLVIDTKNPKILYAATWQRHRNIANYLGGGPGSGIYKSVDAGDTWQKLTNGIPKSNLGKIGLAISPFNSETIYASIETDRISGGLFMSVNGGISWKKQSSIIAEGTGPHYYQELYASPHHEGQLFFTSNNSKISNDHGKTFYYINEKNKHVDTHAIAFKKLDPNYVLFGTDGGLFETYDLTKTWHFFDNLPVAQYYKIAVDDAKPFYHIYGGTQDNGSHGVPSQTMSPQGIENSDWWTTLGADGHQSATEPGNPNITYGEFQEGMSWRIDQTTGEIVSIQPQAKQNEPIERFNWDAPILVSPHKPSRIYVASQRVWKSENRGDKWTPISTDLTKNQERFALPIMGKQQSWDNAWDVIAMSNYNTITSLSESPIQEGLLYAGTDDGIIQVTEDGGESWRKIELKSIKKVPETVFVNNIKADLFDANTVYAVLDNHKFGDFKPYLIKSTDKGKSWHLINGDLPKRLLTWRLVQDYKQKDLLFLATENGIYFTKNSGNNWIQLKGGLPTIPFRDITIQKSDDDLVGASFGRGIYVLDDISPIRDFDAKVLESEATLFDIKPAYWYVPKQVRYAQGDNKFIAKNPPYGAVFTYFLKDKLSSKSEIRKKKEKELVKTNSNIHFPGWEALEEEKDELKPGIVLTIKDKEGKVVSTIKGTNKKGFNRVAWHLNYPNKKGEFLQKPKDSLSFFNTRILATPGEYTVTISKWNNGKLSELTSPKQFKVVPLSKGALKGASFDKIDEFRDKYTVFVQDYTATKYELKKSLMLVDAMNRAFFKADIQDEKLIEDINLLRTDLLNIERKLYGYKSRNEVEDHPIPSPRLGELFGSIALSTSTYGPTANHQQVLEESIQQLHEIKTDIEQVSKVNIPNLEERLKAVGAPWIEGQGLLKK